MREIVRFLRAHGIRARIAEGAQRVLISDIMKTVVRSMQEARDYVRGN